MGVQGTELRWVWGDPTGSYPGSPLTTAVRPSRGGRRPCVCEHLAEIPRRRPAQAPWPRPTWSLAAPPWEHVDPVRLLTRVC